MDAAGTGPPMGVNRLGRNGFHRAELFHLSRHVDDIAVLAQGAALSLRLFGGR